MTAIQDKIKEQLPEVHLNEPIAKYSTFNIGANTDYFYQLKDAKQLPSILNFIKSHNIPFFIIGAGSNLLFHDDGFRGIIIKIATKEITLEGTQITADAGVLTSKLLQFSIDHTLTGLEPWAGLPGTIGGAVRGNAGCNGLETKDILLNATLLNPQTGKIISANNKYFQFDYRDSKIKRTAEIVLNATFQLQKRTTSEQEQKDQIMAIHKQRVTKQPFGSSTGSFFKNPSPDKPAGMLIDQAGLKGKTIGGAQISEKHGNFFLNIGNATAQDIIKLAQLAQQTVQEKFSITLEEEVQILSTTGPVQLKNAL